MKTIAGRAAWALKKEIRYLFSFPRPGKILFEHLPKCGGSSLAAYFAEQYPRRKIFCTDGDNPQPSVDEFKRYPQKKRYGYDLVEGHLAHELIEYVHPDSLKITVFREPVERIISHYYYVKREKKHYLHAEVTADGMSLAEYVSSGLSEELHNWYTTHFSGMTDADAEQNPQKSVAKAVETVRKTYDIVGFLDAFDEFAEKVRRTAHLKRQYKDRRENVTRDRPKYADVPETTIRKIEEFNRLDIVFYRKIRALLA